MDNCYQPNAERMPQAEIRAMQNEKIARQVRRAYDGIAHYRRLLDDRGVSPDDIRGIDDLRLLPHIDKEDLRLAYPDGFRAVPASDCVRIHSTSGTTGKRVIAFYTARDIDIWSDCCARALAAAGGEKGDICQIAYGYGLFTGGLGMDEGSRKLGCLTVPVSSGNTDRQIGLMRDLGSSVICCTPSYAAHIAETMRDKGVRPEELKLRIGLFGAEPWTEEMRRSIEGMLGIKAYDIYGLTELSGPGIAFECSMQDGLHVNEDHFFAEIIDPATGDALPDGEKGELVLTSLDKEAFPLIRYRTRDICRLRRDRCACGRTFARMTKPLGRTDDMLIIRGVNVFPSQIEAVLLASGYSSDYRIEIDRINSADTFDVYAEMPGARFSDTVKDITRQEEALAEALREAVGVNPRAHLVAPKSIRRADGKAARVVDRRKLRDEKENE